MSKTLADAAKEAMNRKLDKQAQDMVPKEQSPVMTQESINIDIRDKPRVPEVLRRAHALERHGGLWSLAVVHYDENDTIIKVDRTQPDAKAIALHHLRIANANHWRDLG